MSKHTALCPAPGCSLVGDFARNFCSKHYAEFRRDCLLNGSWQTDASAHHVGRWEYEGDEQSLFEMTEQQEKDERENQDLSGQTK